MSMNQTLETMWKRRSIRRYKPDPLAPQDLNLILEAARRAPTGNNAQNWRIIVVQDPLLRKQTAAACDHQMWMADAAVILCIITLAGEGAVDAAIVLDHAILAATSLGYGTCWIGAYQSAEVKRVLGIPPKDGIVCLTPVGVPGDEPPARKRKSPTELFMQDRFGQPFDYTLD
jgi:nitroreductase